VRVDLVGVRGSQCGARPGADVTAGVPLRGGVFWTSGGSAWTAAGAVVTDPRRTLPPAVRVRAGRVEPPGGLALGAGGAVVRPAEGAADASIGVALGTTLGCFATNAAFQRRLAAQGSSGASPRLFAATVSNAAAGEIGIAFGLAGPAITVTTGATSGLAALDVAYGEVAAGDARGMLVVAVDVVDDLGRRWLREAEWPAETPAEQTAAVLVGEGGRDDLPTLGRVGPVALGVERDASGDAVENAVTWALDRTEASLADVVTHAVGRRAAERMRRVFGAGAALVEAPAPALLAVGGLLTLVRALGERHGPVLVVDVCPSGHVAAVVAWSEP
jgi:hypothetical protein